jgi:hypothetical protein
VYLSLPEYFLHNKSSKKISKFYSLTDPCFVFSSDLKSLFSRFLIKKTRSLIESMKIASHLYINIKRRTNNSSALLEANQKSLKCIH